MIEGLYPFLASSLRRSSSSVIILSSLSSYFSMRSSYLSNFCCSRLFSSSARSRNLRSSASSCPILSTCSLLFFTSSSVSLSRLRFLDCRGVGAGSVTVAGVCDLDVAAGLERILVTDACLCTPRRCWSRLSLRRKPVPGFERLQSG